MSLKFCSFASSPKGSAYFITDGKTSLLVNSGISGKRIVEGIESIDEDKCKVVGILVSHEHINCVQSLKVMGRKIPGAKVYANEGTWPCIEDRVEEARRECFMPEEEFKVGTIMVKAFRTSHYASCPVGFSFFEEGRQISIVTDTGYISEEVYENIKGADILVIEANHDANMLMKGRQDMPFDVTMRIKGDKGLLSNEACGKCVARIASEIRKPRQVILANISKGLNSPDLAHLTIKNILEEESLKVGEDLRLDVITRDRVSPVFVVE